MPVKQFSREREMSEETAICPAKDCRNFAIRKDVATNIKWCQRHFERYAVGHMTREKLLSTCPRCGIKHESSAKWTYCRPCKDKVSDYAESYRVIT